MIYPLIHRLITSLFIFVLATSAFSEQLDPKWQVPRDYFNRLSDQACAGDERAYLELSNTALLGKNPVALNDLGWVFFTQKCTYSKEDLSHAARLYKEAAQAGYPISQSNYAEFLMEGDVIARDPSLAKEYFHRAMDAGYGNAAVTLGLYYFSAEFLPIDDTKASSLYQCAVQEGADPNQLAKLQAELEKSDAEIGMTEIDQRQQLFTSPGGSATARRAGITPPTVRFKPASMSGFLTTQSGFIWG